MCACHVLDSVLNPEDTVGHREERNRAFTITQPNTNSVMGTIKCSRSTGKCKDRRALDELQDTVVCLLPHCLPEARVRLESGARGVFRVGTGWEVCVEIGVGEKDTERKEEAA